MKKKEIMALIGVGIVLAVAVVYGYIAFINWLESGPPPPWHPPYVELNQTVTDDGWNLTVEDLNSIVRLSDVNYYLVEAETNTTIFLESGTLASINGTPSGFNITYFDKDNNGKISRYDVIHISNVGGPSGVAHSGLAFGLVYTEENLVVVDVILK